MLRHAHYVLPGWLVRRQASQEPGPCERWHAGLVRAYGRAARECLRQGGRVRVHPVAELSLQVNEWLSMTAVSCLQATSRLWSDFKLVPEDHVVTCLPQWTWIARSSDLGITALQALTSGCQIPHRRAAPVAPAWIVIILVCAAVALRSNGPSVWTA